MKIYAYIEEGSLVCSRHNHGRTLATINVKPRDTVVEAFKKLEVLGLAKHDGNHWNASKALRKGGVEL